MAESNPVQVTLSDDGIKIINAQNTANNAAGGVTNLNDPNLMSVIEKQNNIGQFAGLTSQYNVIVQNAKDDGIDTTAVTTAYNNLNRFMADILADPDHASDVDRVAYKKYQDAYNQELSNLQNALQNNVNNKFTSAASATSQAASTASQAFSAANGAFSQAQLIGSQADSAMAVQSQATTKAQSTADNAFSQAQVIGSQASAEIATQSEATLKAQNTADSAFSQAATAIDTDQAVSQAVTSLKDGSTLTIAELGNGLATKVSNSEYASYKDQTASQIGQLVTNSAFSAYQTQTADLISSKVATKDFSAYQATTAKAISSKVGSSDFNTYKTQTAGLISSKVDSGDFSTYKTQTDKLIEAKVDNGTYQSDKTQTANDIASKVANKDFETYKSQTADLISSKVATKDFNTYTSQTATAINSKVESGDFNTYKTQTDSAINDKVSSKDYASDKKQTADLISSKVSTADFSTYKIQTATDINLKVSAKDLLDQINLQAGKTLISSSGQLTLSGKNIYFDSANPVIIPSANIDTALVNKKLTAADISANTFTTNNGTFTVDKYGAVVASNLTIRGVTNLVYNAALLGGSGSNIPGWDLSNNGYHSNRTLHDGVPSIGWHNSTGAGVWANFAQSKLYSLNESTGLPYSASVWFLEVGSDTNLKYQFTLAFFDANGKRLHSGYVSNTWNGIGSRQDWRYVTINNAVSPSTAAYVAIEYWAYNGSGYGLFSSPMLTQTAQATGYQPDTGNIISAGEINGSVINGSTVNGATIHGGDLINNANNTSKLYPTTISNDGHIYTTQFYSDAATDDASQTDLSTGALTTKYRNFNTTDPNNRYEAYNTTIQANQISLFAGYTDGKDTSFTRPFTSDNGYLILNPLDGITLHGDTQMIHFSGMSTDTTEKGINFTPYGNLNPAGDQKTWYLGYDSNLRTATFGIDSAGSYPIQFNRNLEVGNLFLGVGHTIGMLDKKPLYFKQGDSSGNMLDIKAGTVYYTGLTKSSLLSVKKDVKKADTAYWAQLVNSIDLATYQYKSDDNTSHIRLSSIVDDVHDTKQWQLPDVFISRDENGKLSGVDDSVLLNATLATVQEQQKEIDQLNGHNMELEARLNKLEAKLNG